jgi:transcriptional regulator with XRE-family HTH domain
MGNMRLRAAMTTKGWTNDALAEVAGVDPKTVERWVNGGRTPHRRIALAVASALEEDVIALWPQLREPRSSKALHPELLALYRRRADAPTRLWWDLFTQAQTHLEVLVYAAVFLHEQHPDLNDLFRRKAATGCQIRILIGDPDSANIIARGEEERFGHGIVSRCRLAQLHYAPLIPVPGIQLRQHATTLYNSLYRADDEMLVNAHLWGLNAYDAPLWHLRRIQDSYHSLFDAYAASFNDVWTTAEPLRG